MTLEEVSLASKRVINVISNHIITVKNQKSTQFAKPAPIVYEEKEFFVLKKYITDLRCKFSQSKFCNLVFPTTSRMNSRTKQNLGLSAAYGILKKLEKLSGKSVSSRILRTSRITSTRQQNLPDSLLNKLADTMNHTRTVADGHYDQSRIEDTVVEVLSNISMNAGELEDFIF